MIQQARNAARWMAAGIAGGIGSTARHAHRRRLGGRWGIILGYHRVIPNDETGSPYRMGMGARLFEAQIRWLAARHRIVSMEEFLTWRASDRTPTEDLVVLTFDDGYRDNLTHAAPILRELGVPAVFYVTSSGLSERMPYWPEVLGQMTLLTEARSVSLGLGRETPTVGPIDYPLMTPAQRTRSCLRMIAELRTLPSAKITEAIGVIATRLGVDPAAAGERTPRLLDADDIRSLASSGFTIGSHSATHPYLPSETIEVQRREIVESKRAIENAVQSPVVDFCYPGGGHDERTRALVREAGYRSAVTWEPGVAGPADDPYALPRKGIGPALATGPAGGFSPSMMEGEITGMISRLLRGKRQRL
jgi:peptidoglycan/xylan/chitin deacetylase (PgdA/CDA1 family)